MTPQEKLDWFWAVGELPGTVFDDLYDRKRKVPGRHRRWQAKWLQPGIRKHHNKESRLNGSWLDPEQED